MIDIHLLGLHFEILFMVIFKFKYTLAIAWSITWIWRKWQANKSEESMKYRIRPQKRKHGRNSFQCPMKEKNIAYYQIRPSEFISSILSGKYWFPLNDDHTYFRMLKRNNGQQYITLLHVREFTPKYYADCAIIVHIWLLLPNCERV